MLKNKPQSAIKAQTSFNESDELIPIENFCKENKGALAFFHIKKGGSDDPVETGYEDLYDTVSRKVWKQWWESKQ